MENTDADTGPYRMVRRTHACTVTHMYETRDRLETPVRAFMRPGVISEAIVEPPVVISPNDTAGDAADLLRNPGATQLLVARRGDCAPAGVVGDLDVLRVLES